MNHSKLRDRCGVGASVRVDYESMRSMLC